MTHRRLLSVLSCVAIGMLGAASGAQASGGSVMAWGSNSNGEIGNGSVGGGACNCVPTPVAVTGISSAAQVSAGGGGAALALLADGAVLGWGDDFYGLIGGGGGNVPSPVPVTKLPAGVVAVDVGGGHALALLGDGTVLAWGDGSQGELGIAPEALPESCGLSKCRKAPQPVPGISNAIAISTAESTNLALLADGTVMAWGYDQNGEVGDGVGRAEGCRCVPTATPVPGVRGAIAVFATTEGGAALLADGGLVDWGTNIEGQIGNGTVSEGGCYCLGPTLVPGLAGVRTMSGGSRFRVAVQASGSLLGWGANNVGQLGTGSTSVKPVPSPIPAGSGTGPYRSIVGGYYNALALLESGAVNAWGYNERGQLGNGTTTQSDDPGAVPGIAGASAVAGHGSAAYALIGPSQTLAVALAGAGTGSVGTDGLLCPATACSAKYPQSQTEILRAEPAAGGFAGFSGACTGTGPCRVKMDSDQTVTATFGVPKGTAITKSDVSSKKKKATFSFTAPGAITGYECKLIKPKPKKRKKGKGRKRVALAKKGRKPKPPVFAPCAAPAAYKNLKPGKYSFEVRALDILGADATPAVKKFTVKKPKPKKKKNRR